METSKPDISTDSKVRTSRRSFLRTAGALLFGTTLATAFSIDRLRAQQIDRKPAASAATIDREVLLSPNEEVEFNGVLWKKQELLSLPVTISTDKLPKIEQTLGEGKFDTLGRSVIFVAKINTQGNLDNSENGISIDNGLFSGEGKQLVKIYYSGGQVFSKFENDDNIGENVVVRSLYAFTPQDPEKVAFDLAVIVNQD